MTGKQMWGLYRQACIAEGVYELHGWDVCPTTENSYPAVDPRFDVLDDFNKKIMETFAKLTTEYIKAEVTANLTTLEDLREKENPL